MLKQKAVTIHHNMIERTEQNEQQKSTQKTKEKNNSGTS